MSSTPRASSASSRLSSIPSAAACSTPRTALDQERLRDLHADKERKPLLALERARANRHRVDFSDLSVPEFTGRREVEADLATLRDYIDWQFFFHAWELKGKFPQILEQPAARELWDDAQALLDQIVSGSLLQAKGVFGFWPAHADGDDVVVGDTRFSFLRQQTRLRRLAPEPEPRRLRRARGRLRRRVRGHGRDRCRRAL